MALLDGVHAELGALRQRVEAHDKRHDMELEMLQRVEAALQEPRMDPKYISPAQAAVRYGVSKDTISEIYKMPEAPGVLKVGQRILIPIAEFDAFLADAFPYAA